MRAADLIIIYFALGSPFAVYAVKGRPRPLSLGQYGAITARFFLWPVLAGAYFLRWMIEDEPLAETIRRQRIVDLREQIEEAAFGGRSTPALFEFRDMFERYAALTLSLDTDPYSHPLLGLSGHTSKLGAACIYRRERERVSFHQARARSEFAEFVSSVHALQQTSGLVGASIELAAILDDKQSVVELSKLPMSGDAAALAATPHVVRNAAP